MAEDKVQNAEELSDEDLEEVAGGHTAVSLLGGCAAAGGIATQVNL